MGAPKPLCGRCCHPPTRGRVAWSSSWIGQKAQHLVERLVGEQERSIVERDGPGREFGDHNSIGAVDDKILPVNTHCELYLRRTIDRIPAASVAHHLTDWREEGAPLAVGPGRSVAI